MSFTLTTIHRMYIGYTFLFYAEGDQKTWAKVYSAIYKGSEKQFFRDLRNRKILEDSVRG